MPSLPPPLNPALDVNKHTGPRVEEPNRTMASNRNRVDVRKIRNRRNRRTAEPKNVPGGTDVLGK